MNWFEGIFLGLVQGLTEFLPVSSSGHLTIFSYFLNAKEAGLTFDILLHFATLLSVIICYRKDLWELIRHPLQRYVLLIIIASIPAGIAGVVFGDFFASLFENIWVPAIALLFTAALLFVADRFRGDLQGKDMTWWMALFIGVMQMIAICPGISRSGATIFIALLIGLSRTEAAKFSFIMSIPVILGSFLLETVSVVKNTGTFALEPVFLVAAAVAAVSGVLAIKLVVNLLNKGRLRYFAYYCALFAMTTILFLSLGM
ncbi:MAG TPA: undecaprenyl-diphosphate phosphatase [Clostridiales bacterium]|nr:undecaprenyl-diphosphate phosphatase [Clostridiales bacterium]